MSVPTATYRIQFRNGMTFDRVCDLVPYLKRLGISHLYASPIFTATSGSTHGYDVTDANEIDPAIGGRDGFDRMARALKASGLGLILDIVPNHMAASLENPWWRDVIENGEASRYARYFDIDWSRRLTLPFLGDNFDTVLSAGDIAVKPDPETGKPTLAYFESFYPLNPATWQGREDEVLALTDAGDIAALHDRQPYRLMSWRDAPRDLSYRRFFEITGLAGLRVEDRTVFDDSHRLILELVRSGTVDGLRVDHVDGLTDPKAYLERLRQEAGTDCYITVEKILGEGEQIAPDWPISGTTGYEFIAALSQALVDGDKLIALRDAYDTATGGPVDMAAELRRAKLLLATRNFAGEFSRLAGMVVEMVPSLEKGASGHPSDDALRNALLELLVAFPVYRTYGTAAGLPQSDRDRLAEVVATVKAGPQPPDDAALELVRKMLTGEVPEAVSGHASQFRNRFQQLTGPLMAKSVEDTLFFRKSMLLALNEVGAEPLPHPFSLDGFHEAMRRRLSSEPDALSGTSTHDTKRGEDARARLYTLSEAPDIWAGAVERWRDMNRAAVTALQDGPAPEPEVEWMLYQALAGVWPTDLGPSGMAGLEALQERFLAFVEKALREAKLRTDWGTSNEAYETAVLDYARHLFSTDGSTFRADFVATLQPFLRAGIVNSLTQAIVKLTAPGVPDIYQGCEGLDFSLVDPDNRRMPDFAALRKQIDSASILSSTQEADWLSGRLKQEVTAKLLHLRQQAPTLFRKGDYLPLQLTGRRSENILAYGRTESDDALVVIAPRLVFDAIHPALDASPAQAGRWEATEIMLPASLAGRRYRDVFTGKAFDFGQKLAVMWAFTQHPFAVLKAE